LSGFTDETKYWEMLRNRPNPSIIPSPNRRLLAQRIGSNTLINLALIGILLGLTVTQAKELFSWKLNPTRKVFEFKSDPMTGAVSCTYQEKVYKQEGY